MKSLLKRNTIILIFTVILSVWFGGIAMSGISDGLVAYYPFNNNAIDETGNGYDGTVVGATPTDDRNGVPESAYAFDGTNDYINLGTSLNVPSWSNYAVSLWFLHDGGGTDARGYGQQILDKSTWYTDFHLMIQTMYNANGELRYWTVQNTVGGNTIIDNRDFRDNQWHHVVINKQGKDGALWVDGVKRGTSDNVYTVINDQPLLVGYSFHGDGYQRQYFSGKIDDIRIYNRVLSEDEIEILNDVREAEDFDVGAGKFITGDDANASGGHYMWAPNGSGNKWTPSETHKLEYRFNVEQEGYYRIKGRVHAANDNDDSFWVKVNSSPPSGYLWDVMQNTNYALDYVSDRDVEDPVEVCLPVGNHTVGVYLREDGTRLDTIGLEFARSGRCFPPLHGDLEMEAEDGDIYGGKFKIGSDPNASGEKYVEAPNGSGNKWTIGEADRLEYRFTVEEEGYYRVWGGVHAAGDNDDSFWVRVDGEPSRGYLWDVRQNTTYALDYVSDRDVEAPVEVCLPVGNHTVTVYLREDGTRLDTIGLERSGSCTLPPPPPDLEMEAEDGDIYGGKFKIGSAPNASGEKYVEAPNGSGNKWTIGEVDRLEYRLTVEEEGYYRVKGRVHAASGIDDSFWVKVDGEPSSGYLWDVLQNTTYQSDYVSDRDGEDPVEVCLTAGDHTVTVYLREDGTRLDTIGLEFVRSGSCFANDGLVLNGGFEEGIYSPTESPVNWTWDAWQPSAIPTWDDTQAHTGDKSVKIDAPAPNDARWIQTVDVEPNKLYFLSGWIKTENVGHTSESVDAGANLSLFGT